MADRLQVERQTGVEGRDEDAVRAEDIPGLETDDSLAALPDLVRLKQRNANEKRCRSELPALPLFDRPPSPFLGHRQRDRRGDRQYAYALTFWSQDNPWVLSDVTLGQTVSRLAWEHFSATYQ